MAKKSYKKPEIKEVKLTVEDTLLSACRTAPNARAARNRIANNNCRACRTTYSAS